MENIICEYALQRNIKFVDALGSGSSSQQASVDEQGNSHARQWSITTDFIEIHSS
jgi:hypothetical protein